MLKAKVVKYPLIFKQPGGTSRGILTQKNSWFIKVLDEKSPELFGLGECSLIKGLSYDDRPELEKKIKETIENINILPEDLYKYPALNFAVETAMLDLESGGQRILFPSDFTNSQKSISINGLIWMGNPEFMRKQIREKIEQGFRCLKLKIGTLDFETELEIIREIREIYALNEIEIRVDANGAFSPEEALEKLNRLSEFGLHSIEQPIRAGQPEQMAELCANTPLPIALDEELIGVFAADKKTLLEKIKPQYIILKPSLLGGFKQSEEWIKIANELGIGWWITSALESNIGLNAIAQWTYTLNNPLPQGLGTGQVFSNNIPSPLIIEKGYLKYADKNKWIFKNLNYE